MVDVFISYSRSDEAAVRQLARKIEAEGYEVWWDAELPPHKSYGEVIQEKVAMCKAAVVVWSDTAGQSEWVRAEADLARNAKKLIQTALGDIMPPLPFNQIQFANIGDWHGEDDHTGWRKVKASLAELCGPREAPAERATQAHPLPVTPPPQAARPQPAPPQPAPTPIAPPPGSLEAHRSSGSNAPLFIGLAVGALGLLGGAFFLAAAIDGDADEEVVTPVALAEPAGADMPDISANEAPAQPAAPAAAPPPVQAAAPAAAPAASYPTGQQNFTGSLNNGQSRSYTVGLNAGTSYMIVGECDLDCSDIDAWLYDENGNLVDSDTLDDDVPVLEVTPVRSAQFSVRVEMFTCTVEPCGIQVSVMPQ